MCESCFHNLKSSCEFPPLSFYRESWKCREIGVHGVPALMHVPPIRWFLGLDSQHTDRRLWLGGRGGCYYCTNTRFNSNCQSSSITGMCSSGMWTRVQLSTLRNTIYSSICWSSVLSRDPWSTGVFEVQGLANSVITADIITSVRLEVWTSHHHFNPLWQIKEDLVVLMILCWFQLAGGGVQALNPVGLSPYQSCWGHVSSGLQSHWHRPTWPSCVVNDYPLVFGHTTERIHPNTFRVIFRKQFGSDCWLIV